MVKVVTTNFKDTLYGSEGIDVFNLNNSGNNDIFADFSTEDKIYVGGSNIDIAKFSYGSGGVGEDYGGIYYDDDLSDDVAPVKVAILPPNLGDIYGNFINRLPS